jgi:hypothetical protein
MRDDRALIAICLFAIQTPATIMRLLTHNSLQNNSAEAKGKGYPLRITVAQFRVEEGPIEERHIGFIKGVLPILDWPALVKVTISKAESKKTMLLCLSEKILLVFQIGFAAVDKK